jgi:hypothetical protein
MSTQRREDGPTAATEMSRPEARDRWQRTGCTERAMEWSQLWLILVAWLGRAIAIFGTVPASATYNRLRIARLAPNSLQLDYHTTELVRQDLRRTSRSSPPSRAGSGATPGTPATRRSSLPLIPSPSVLDFFRTSWPHSGSSIHMAPNRNCSVAFS